MGLFGLGKKKEKAHCAVCGQEISGYAFSAVDGKLCDDCREKINTVMPVEQWSELTVAEIRAQIEGKDDICAAQNQTTCSVCGKPFDTAYPTIVADGKICSECDRIMRGTYFRKTVIIDPKNPADREKYADELVRIEQDKCNGKISLTDPYTITEDELSDVMVEWIRSDMETRKERLAKAIADFGTTYRNIFYVDESFAYELGALDGGIRRKKALKDKLVVSGMVAAGQFTSGDDVVLIRGTMTQPVKILEVVPCQGSDFDIEISTNFGEQTVSEDANAWLVLDMDFTELALGDIIAGNAISR